MALALSPRSLPPWSCFLAPAGMLAGRLGRDPARTRTKLTVGAFVSVDGKNGVDAVVSIDVHHGDRGSDVLAAACWLSERGLSATFFVPTAILGDPDVRAGLQGAAAMGFELGSHGHQHDWQEIQALERGDRHDLTFLARSRDAFEDAFGASPRVFRSPVWCGLSRLAIETLAGLGYLVDSSSTPQRPGLFSSRPFENPWILASRAPVFVTPTLLEVPQSTIAVPFGAPTFSMLRRRGSRLMARALMLESRLSAGARARRSISRDVLAVATPKPLVAQFHPQDFIAYPRVARKKTRRFSIAEFWPVARGGMAFRQRFRVVDPTLVHEITCAVLDAMSPCTFRSFAKVHSQALAAVQAHSTDGPR
jgi:peptidoglycan/xylan/chitin deacetylase (PgdA/CDA1 family)